jgi:hypothetical protein
LALLFLILGGTGADVSGGYAGDTTHADTVEDGETGRFRTSRRQEKTVS